MALPTTASVVLPMSTPASTGLAPNGTHPSPGTRRLIQSDSHEALSTVGSTGAVAGTGSKGTLEGTHRFKSLSGGKCKPVRAEFATEAEFNSAWTKWRESRDENNKSVKLSRQRARMRRLGLGTTESLQSMRELALQQEVTTLREEIRFLMKVIRFPDTLVPEEQQHIQSLTALFNTVDSQHQGAGVGEGVLF